MVLSAFFVGFEILNICNQFSLCRYDVKNEIILVYRFVLMNVPGGQLAEKYGAKPVVATALCVASVASFLTPVVALIGGAPALIGWRFLMGLSQGGLFPACTALLSAWAPLHERGRLASLIYCGAPAGMLIGNFLSGYLLQWYGWHVVFYVFGFIGGIIAVLYVIRNKQSSYSSCYRKIFF